MTQWATSLRESYRRLQRAMARQTQQALPSSSLKETGPVRQTTPLTTPSRERRSDRATPQARHETFATFPDVEVTSNPVELETISRNLLSPTPLGVVIMLDYHRMTKGGLPPSGGTGNAIAGLGGMI